MRKAILAFLFLATTAYAHDVATFSIVARDPNTKELGVAVASRFFSVGSVVPYASASAGAVATQANANVAFGPRGLDLLQRGATAEETLKIRARGGGEPSAATARHRRARRQLRDLQRPEVQQLGGRPER